MSGHPTPEELIDHHYGGEPVDADHLRSCGACSELSDRVARERTALREACLVREAAPAGLVHPFPAMRFGAAAVGFCAVLITILWSTRETPPEPPVSDPRPDFRVQAGPDEVQEEEEGVQLACLKWLLRHQAEDGSWGRRPATCRCPVEGAPAAPRRNPEVEKKARALTPLLGKDDPAERDRVTSELRKLGEAVEPALEEAARGPDPEVRARAGDLLREFARARETPSVEATGLSLVAFMGAGYTHLSKDRGEGRCVGDAVRLGLQWLMRQQGPEGAVGGAPREGSTEANALGALALAEAYGLTGSNLFKGQAQAAVDFVCGRQRPGGAWGPGRDDFKATVASMELVFSARISELAARDAAMERGVEWLRRASDGGGRESSAYAFAAGLEMGTSGQWPVEKGKVRPPYEKPDAKRAVERVAALKPSELDPYDCYLASYAMIFVDGPSGDRWKAWNERMKNALVPSQKHRKEGCLYGSWDPAGPAPAPGSRLFATALNALTLEVYYRHSNVWSQK